MSPKICNVPEFWTIFEKKYFFFGFLKKCLEIRVFVHQTDRGVPCKEIAQLFISANISKSWLTPPMSKLIAVSFKNLRSWKAKADFFSLSRSNRSFCCFLLQQKQKIWPFHPSKIKSSRVDKPSKLMLSNWFVFGEDGQLFAGVDTSLQNCFWPVDMWCLEMGTGQLHHNDLCNIAENCLPWKQSFAGGERKQQGCGSWARGPPAAAPVHPGSSVQTDTTGTWQQLFHTFLQQEAVNTVAAPVYYPSPNVSRPASQLTEEEQVLRKIDMGSSKGVLRRRGGFILNLPIKLRPPEGPLMSGGPSFYDSLSHVQCACSDSNCSLRWKSLRGSVSSSTFPLAPLTAARRTESESFKMRS